MTDDGSCPNLNAMHGHDVHVVALDGDKLKPREDQRKGGNGFGINEEGAGYTLTGVDRHGVAYKAVGGNGKEDVSTVLTARSYKGIGARNGEISGAFVAVECYENHAQDSRVKPIDVSDTRNQKDVTGGNNLPLVVSMAQNTRDEVRIVGGDGQIAGALPAEPGMKQQTYVVSTNSNGEDVAATISANMSKLGGDNQTTFGGGYAIIRREEGANDEPQL